MKIKGKAFYCFTTKRNDKGKYPSHSYEIGIKDPVIADTALEKFIKTRRIIVEDGTEVIEDYIKIANSKYEFPMFDKNANRLDHSVAIPNDTKIIIDVDVKVNKEYDKEYLVVKGVQICEDIKEYNPFEPVDDDSLC